MAWSTRKWTTSWAVTPFTRAMSPSTSTTPVLPKETPSMIRALSWTWLRGGSAPRMSRKLLYMVSFSGSSTCTPRRAPMRSSVSSEVSSTSWASRSAPR